MRNSTNKKTTKIQIQANGKEKLDTNKLENNLDKVDEVENTSKIQNDAIEKKEIETDNSVDVNIFSVFPSACNEETIENDDQNRSYTIEPLVTEKTDFQPPELFTDFKFDQKVIIDVLSDYIPSKENPEDAKLFTTNIPEIEGKNTDIDHQSVDTSNTSIEGKLGALKMETKTPILAFKEREGVSRKTPTSTPKRLSMSARRASLTPNPMNFLHKNEDPVALKTETPKSRRSLNLGGTPLKSTETDSEESESVKHFTNLVAAEEAKFKASVDKWEKILEENLAPEERKFIFVKYFKVLLII